MKKTLWGVLALSVLAAAAPFAALLLPAPRTLPGPTAAPAEDAVPLPTSQPLPTAPAAANTSQVASVMNTPFSATFSAPARSFWPRRRDKRALMPVAVPTATATIRFCTGNTRFTLASAFSLSMATKMLSTTL